MDGEVFFVYEGKMGGQIWCRFQHKYCIWQSCDVPQLIGILEKEKCSVGGTCEKSRLYFLKI